MYGRSNLLPGQHDIFRHVATWNKVATNKTDCGCFESTTFCCNQIPQTQFVPLPTLHLNRPSLMLQIYAAGPAGSTETEVSERTGAGGRKINWGNQQVQSLRGDVNSSETRWAVGAWSRARLVSHVFSFLAAGLIECSLCYLWLWEQLTLSLNRHNTSRQSLILISTKGPECRAQLQTGRSVSSSVDSCASFLKEKAILWARLLRGIKLRRVVNSTATHRILKLFRAVAFITLYERLARSASGIDVWSVAFSFYKWGALSIHLILCKAYFSLDSLVRAE